MTEPRVVELRLRASWVPGGSFRYEVGRARTAAERKKLDSQRAELRRLARRGDWDVLNSLKAGRLTLEQVLATVDRFGVENYRAHLPAEKVEAPPATAPTLRQHVDAWLLDCDANPDLRASSVVQYRKAIDKLLRFEVDGVPLSERPWHQIPRHTIRDARASLDLSPNTGRQVLGCWSSFFQWAVDREESQAEHEERDPLIQANPVRRAAIWSRIQKTRHRFLAHPEFTKLLEVSPPPMRAQYATLTLAGLRIDEFMKLPPSHVRLEQGTLHVGPFGDWKPKVERSTRDIPIHPALHPLLEEYLTEWGGHELTFFVSPSTGRPWGYHGFKDRMRIDVEAAGLKFGAWSGKGSGIVRHAQGITAHTLRHTFGSWLAQDDVQLGKIAKLMGDTEETVNTHYLHLLPSDLTAAVARLTPTIPARVNG